MTLAVVTGRGHALDAACDPRPYLKVRKMRKFMGAQDAMAVVAAGLALADAGLSEPLGERAGLYLGVGYLPFVQEDIERLLRGAIVEGAFSMPGFASEGYNAVNPLLTFRCLSNMPAFHVSSNFGIQGPYLTTYPGPGQLYQALEEAVFALEEGRIDVALLLGVAHQRNFLVRHHFARVDDPIAADDLLDGAGCLVLETPAHAQARGAPFRGELFELRSSYTPFHPFEEAPAPEELFAGCSPPGELGPATLPVALARGDGVVHHSVQTRDGVRASSRWQVTP